MKILLALIASLCLFGSTASAQHRRPPIIVQRPIIIAPSYPFYGRPFVAPPVFAPPVVPYYQPFLYPYTPTPAFGYTETFRFRFNQFGFQYKFGSFGWTGWW